ncbi:MAG: UbiX family flavin prenyltransferase [Campylobacter curvus]
MKKVIVAITGASGVCLGFDFLKTAVKFCEIHCVISKNAMRVLNDEMGIILDTHSMNPAKKGIVLASSASLNNALNLDAVFRSPNAKFYDDEDIGAALASGSFGADAMMIAPCSINTLAKISCGLADTLITRAAAVMLKERKRLVLGVRETPFSTISLRQMSELSELGVIIAPPILGYYAHADTLSDMQNFIIGKWLDALGIENEIYKRWKI